MIGQQHSPTRAQKWFNKAGGDLDGIIAKRLDLPYAASGRFLHGTRFLRWRPDKSPRQCTMDQVTGREGKSLALL